jgi:glutamyl-tRNA reductase
MNLFCFGISYQTASVDVRERFAIPDVSLVDAVLRLKSMVGVEEGVVVSTCNRTEFYVATAAGSFDGSSFFAQFYGKDPDKDAGLFYRHSSSGTVRHLFRVVTGLESMVVGETEIFGQVKRAYETAARQNATGKWLNRLFQKSFQVGKHVRSGTKITRGSVSVGSVAVDLAEGIFGRLAGCKIMILGAGETSEKTARAFQSRGACQIFVSNRSYERARELAQSMDGRALRFDDWREEFHDLDILVSSTAAPHLLLTVDDLRAVLHKRRDRPLFIIDLAVPRDIDPGAHGLDGVYYYDIDALRVIAERTRTARRDEETTCAGMIEQYVRDFDEWFLRAGRPPLASLPVEWQRM